YTEEEKDHPKKMTTEEIERILQTVAENQAQLTGAAARTDERLDRVGARLDQIGERLDQVAALQAKHDEMHARHAANMAEITTVLARHSADIVEIDSGIASLLNSQNRYEERQAALSDILHDIADKQLKNEERFAETDKRFAELAAAQVRSEASY